jgi:hypothetical protein
LFDAFILPKKREGVFTLPEESFAQFAEEELKF